MGGGQFVADDCLINADILFQKPKAGDANIGGILCGLLRNALGAIAVSVHSTLLQAQVLLTLDNVHSGHQEAIVGGTATKRNIGFNVGALLIGGGVNSAGGGGFYTITEIGQIVMMAYVDGLNKLVTQSGELVG